MSMSTLDGDLQGNIFRYIGLATAAKARLVSTEFRDSIKANNLDLADTYVCENQKLLGAKRQRELVQAFNLENQLWTHEYIEAMRMNITKQEEIDNDMYEVLILWLCEVHFKLGVVESCLHLTVQIINNYLALNEMKLCDFQMLGATAMLIAFEYNKYKMCLSLLCHITDDTSTVDGILAMKRRITGQLGDLVQYKTPSDFLQRFLKAAGFEIDNIRPMKVKNTPPAYSDVYAIAFYFIDVLLTDGTLCHIKPSLAAAAAVMCTQRVFGDYVWSLKLQYYTTYSCDDVNPIAAQLVSTHINHLSIPLKYSSDRYSGVLQKILLLTKQTVQYISIPQARLF